jgi:hypothetical protein
MARKNSHGALLALTSLYETFATTERVLADQVFCEWITSGNTRMRFDALAMVDRFYIVLAVPFLRTLEAALAPVSGPEAEYELSRVRQILGSLIARRP